MATVLDKVIKRQVRIDGVDYMVALDPEGIWLTPKGNRRPEVELRSRELVSGHGAMGVAVNASLAARPAAAKSASEPKAAPAAMSPPARKKAPSRKPQ